MEEKKPVTPKQLAVYKWICKFIKKNDISPTIKEISDHFKTTYSNAARFCNELKEKGYVTRDPKKKYSLRIKE